MLSQLESNIPHFLLQFHFLKIDIGWKLSLKGLNCLFITFRFDISFFYFLFDLSQSLEMILIPLEKIVVHMSREVFVHVKSHALVLHVSQQVIVVIAVILIPDDRDPLNNHTVNNITLIDITDQVLPQLPIVRLVLDNWHESLASLELNFVFFDMLQVCSQSIPESFLGHGPHLDLVPGAQGVDEREEVLSQDVED